MRIPYSCCWLNAIRRTSRYAAPLQRAACGRYQGCDEWPQHRQDLEHHLVLDTTPRSPIEGSPVALAEQCIQWLVSRGLYRHP